MWSSVRKTNPVWYFDSTGNVIKKIENQSEPFLYSIVFHDKQKKLIFPLAEFISTAHDSHSISGFLYTIKLELERSLKKESFQIAPIICTDFSYAFLKMIIRKVKSVKKFDEAIQNSEQKNLNKKTNSKIEKTFIFSFTLLQSSTKIDEFITNLKDINILFNTRNHSEAIKIASNRIKKQLIERDLTIMTIVKDAEKTELQYEEDINYHDYVKFNSNAENDSNSLKKKSPFAIYFKNLLSNDIELERSKLSDINKKIVENEYYCPEMFQIIVQYLHVVPLWTLISIKQWQNINKKFEKIDRLTNNPVENWFNQVKNKILLSKRTMPSIHATNLLNLIESSFKLHYENENIKLNKNKKMLPYQEEIWKKSNSKRHKSKFYSGINTGFIDELGYAPTFTGNENNNTIFSFSDTDESMFQKTQIFF